MTRPRFTSQNPFTKEIHEVVEGHDALQVADILARASRQSRPHDTRRETRMESLRNLSRLLDGQSNDLACLATEEMGKPIGEAQSEIAKSIRLCKHYEEQAAHYLADEEIPMANGNRARVQSLPLGVILGIMPWNYPFWQAFRFIIPTVLAGNAALLKHAANVPRCARRIEDIMREAGFGEDAYATLLVERGAIANIISDTRVRAVSLTGSEQAGRSVAETAGKALKPCLLELGGCDPLIVLADANIEAAAEAAVTSRLANAGQSCIAAKRFLVSSQVFDEFRDAVVARVKSMTVGDPMNEGTDMGPLARESSIQDCNDAIMDANRKGARILVEGGATGEGWCFRPYVISQINSEMMIATEEVFGPVITLRKIGSDKEAIDLANEPRFGLGASIWSQDTARAERLSAQLECGMVAINDFVASHPEVPFGGVKSSGYGRELGRDGIQAFANRQAVVS